MMEPVVDRPWLDSVFWVAFFSVHWSCWLDDTKSILPINKSVSVSPKSSLSKHRRQKDRQWDNWPTRRSWCEKRCVCVCVCFCCDSRQQTQQLSVSMSASLLDCRIISYHIMQGGAKQKLSCWPLSVKKGAGYFTRNTFKVWRCL